MSLYKGSCLYTLRSVLGKLFCCTSCRKHNINPPNDDDTLENETRSNDSLEEGHKDKIIKIATYNTQILIGKVSKRKLEHLTLSLIDVRDEIDILCLQEVFVEDGREYLIKKLKDIWPHYVHKAGEDLFVFEDSGLMFFSKFPIISYVFNPYQKSIGSDILADKGYLKVKVKINKTETLTVVNTHLQSDYGIKNKDGAVVRHIQLEVLKKQKCDILMGDLNVICYTLEYKKMTKILSHLKDVYSSDKDGEESKKVKKRPNTHEDDGVLDYIFVKPKYRVLSNKVTTLERGGKIPSDHYLLISTITSETLNDV